MPGEPILIVDDTPINLKLIRLLLAHEGYETRLAASAEEALEAIADFHPRLVLADVQLPGMDGLELARRIKRDERTRDISVVALTAFAGPDDEQMALDAGCDAYIAKPIDTRTLCARVRGFLDHAAGQAPSAAPPTPRVLPKADAEPLRRRFLEEGLDCARQLLADVDGNFRPAEAGKAAHQWVGTAGLLGFVTISRLARELEGVLAERPLDNAQLRDSLAALVAEFISPAEGRASEG
jgi:CheY-like chemotaxis protein